MAIDLSALASITSKATSLSNIILATPQEQFGYQPQNPPSEDGTVAPPPPTLVFDYEGEQSVTLESDITDHYVEDNTAVSDQIALRPEIIDTHGFLGELNNVTPRALRPLRTAVDKLTPLVAYTPELTAAALEAYNQALFAYQIASNVADAAVGAWNNINGESGTVQTKQQAMFQQFYGYWRNRTLFTVQTPWGIFDDCAIQTLRAIQDEETGSMTDFAVSFKKIRFAETVTRQTNITLLEGRAAAQASDPIDMGVSNPLPSIPLTQGLAANFPGVA